MSSPFNSNTPAPKRQIDYLPGQKYHNPRLSATRAASEPLPATHLSSRALSLILHDTDARQARIEAALDTLVERFGSLEAKDVEKDDDTPDPPTCRGHKADGTRCGARATDPFERFCWRHVSEHDLAPNTPVWRLENFRPSAACKADLFSIMVDYGYTREELVHYSKEDLVACVRAVMDSEKNTAPATMARRTRTLSPSPVFAGDALGAQPRRTNVNVKIPQPASSSPVDRLQVQSDGAAATGVLSTAQKVINARQDDDKILALAGKYMELMKPGGRKEKKTLASEAIGSEGR